MSDKEQIAEQIMADNIQPNPRIAMPVRRVSAPPPSGFALTPKDILSIIRRHLLLIIFTTTVGIIAGGSSWYLLRKYSPKYTAQTYVEVLQPGRSDPTSITTPMVNKEIAYQFRYSKAALIKQQRRLEELLKRDKIRATKWFRSFPEATRIVEAIGDLGENLGASAEKNSSYIRVSMTCGDPAEAALIVNETVDLFVKTQQESASGDVNAKLLQLNEQQNRLQRELNAANAALDDLRVASGLTQLEAEGGDSDHTITVKLSDLEIRQSQLNTTIKQIEANVQNLEQRTIDSEIVQRAMETDPIVINLTNQINLLESELARKLTKLGENHREVQQTKQTIKQTMSERDERALEKARQIRESDITNAYDQLAILKNELAENERLRAETENRQKDLDATRIRYNNLLDIKEERKETLASIREQIEKYNMIKEDAETAKVRAIGKAPPPFDVSFPQISVFLPGGTFLGMMFGVGLAFLIELLNDLLRTPRDVMRNLNVALVGMICHKDQDEDVEDVDVWNVVRQAPYSITSECYRQLRTNLKLSNNSENNKVILVASGSGSEGRTTVAVNMASTFVAEGKKVLIIDANFRRPASHIIFPPLDEEPAIGLSNYLAEGAELQQVIRSTGMPGFDVIDSGELPANPSELLSSSKMSQLLDYCRVNYDNIIIDGPPMLVSDAKSLASQADGTILVLNATLTRKGAAQRIIREIRETDANLLGAVLIGVKTMKGGYFEELFKSYREYQTVKV